MTKQLLNRIEVAVACGVSLRTVDRHIAAGEIPVVTLGRRKLVPAAWLERMLGTPTAPLGQPSTVLDAPGV